MKKPKTGTVAVIGLGYVGLPLATLAQEKGWHVIGVDIDKAKVAAIQKGINPLVDEALSRQLKKYPIAATTDFSEVAAADIIVVAVPTPVTHAKLPDLSPLVSAIQNLLPHFKSGQTLIVESTINPGIMDGVVMPLLAARPELMLHVAYCPERINPGDKKWNVRNIPRVLGAYTMAAKKNALAFYTSVIEAPIKLMDSVTEAEAVKIFENSFRDINIAFVNEMAKSFDKLGIDVVNVIEGAKTKPFAFLAHYPGNGVGGHCIGVDPYYMIERGRQVNFDHKFLKLAREINESMPKFVIDLLERGLTAANLSPNEAAVALLGIAYKKDTADTRESPALVIGELLRARTEHVSIFDPYAPQHSNVKNLEQALKTSQVVIIGIDHSEFVKTITPEKLTKHGIKLVIDGKNALDGAAIAAAGIPYFGIGRTHQPVPITQKAKTRKKVAAKA